MLTLKIVIGIAMALLIVTLITLYTDAIEGELGRWYLLRCLRVMIACVTVILFCLGVIYFV